MIKTIPERVIASADAPDRLAEILKTIEGDQIWLVSENGEPKVAIIDAHFLEQLMRRAWFDDLAARSQAGFQDYLQREGYDSASTTEEQIEDILQK